MRSALLRNPLAPRDSRVYLRPSSRGLALQFEVVGFCDNRFDELVELYNNFEPKRAAQGLPPVGRERIAAWLRHLQKSGHNLLALWNGNVIGHSMLCPMEHQRAEFAIFLHQDFRNQGIGTGLTEVTLKSEQRMRDPGLQEERVSCQWHVWPRTGNDSGFGGDNRKRGGCP